MEEKCEDCGRRYSLGELPDGDDVKIDRCPDCNALVLAVEEINGAGPFFLADSISEAKTKDEQLLHFEQCENCGNSEYTYYHIPRYVKCSGKDGCGTKYRVKVYRTYAVVFP